MLVQKVPTRSRSVTEDAAMGWKYDYKEKDKKYDKKEYDKKQHEEDKKDYGKDKQRRKKD
jgi:hypothetical protein